MNFHKVLYVTSEGFESRWESVSLFTICVNSQIVERTKSPATWERKEGLCICVYGRCMFSPCKKFLTVRLKSVSNYGDGSDSTEHCILRSNCNQVSQGFGNCPILTARCCCCRRQRSQTSKQTHRASILA